MRTTRNLRLNGGNIRVKIMRNTYDKEVWSAYYYIHGLKGRDANGSIHGLGIPDLIRKLRYNIKARLDPNIDKVKKKLQENEKWHLHKIAGLVKATDELLEDDL